MFNSTPSAGAGPPPFIPDPTPSDLLTASEVATILRVKVQTVRAWVRSGELAAINLGHAGFRFRRGDIDRFLASRLQPQTA